MDEQTDEAMDRHLIEMLCDEMISNDPDFFFRDESILTCLSMKFIEFKSEKDPYSFIGSVQNFHPVCFFTKRIRR